MTVFQELEALVTSSLEQLGVSPTAVRISYPEFEPEIQDGVLRLQPRDDRCLPLQFVASGDLVLAQVGLVGRAELDWTRRKDTSWLVNLLRAVIGGSAEEHVWDPDGASPSGFVLIDGRRRLTSNHVFSLRPPDLVRGGVPYGDASDDQDHRGVDSPRT